MENLESSDVFHIFLNALSQHQAVLLKQIDSLRKTLPKPPLLPTPFRAAVVVLISEQDKHIILMQRPLNLPIHPGQISFPGGQLDKSDLNLEQTALRETFEEIGIPANDIRLVGHMGEWPTVSGFMVTPYIGVIDKYHSETYLINAEEVDKLIFLPLEHLLNLEHHFIKPIETPFGTHEVYSIRYLEYDIWGLTGLLLGVLARLALQKPLNV